MTVDGKRKNISVIRILQLMSLGQNAEQGTTVREIDELRVQARASREKLLVSSLVLPQMEQAGLIERRAESNSNNSKPYFITEAGKLYLANAQLQAMSTEPGQHQDWADRETGPNLQRTVAALLRTIPEFDGSSEQRIQEVSQQLTTMLILSTTR